eukprot:4156627-Alexandrium_andersonii.AAC.1
MRSTAPRPPAADRVRLAHVLKWLPLRRARSPSQTGRRVLNGGELRATPGGPLRGQRAPCSTSSRPGPSRRP